VPRGKKPTSDLAATLGYTFLRTELLDRALTHSSVAERPRDSSERLEFLGDRVLGLVVADMLLREFPNEREGEIARRFAWLVDRGSLADVATMVGLAEFIDHDTGEHVNNSVLSDIMEAVIGAIYRDGGLEAARPVVEKMWTPLAGREVTPPVDPKSELQEWAQARHLPLPAYRVTGRSGSDHAPQFNVEAVIRDKPPATGSGPSKRLAERAAAEALLAIINEFDNE
jgi:ribonuclease-3